MTSESGEDKTPDDTAGTGEASTPDDTADAGETSTSDRPPLLNLGSRAFSGSVILRRRVANAEILGDTAVGQEDSPSNSQLVATHEQIQDAKDRDSERTLRAEKYEHEKQLQKSEHEHRARMQRLVLVSLFATLGAMFLIVMIAPVTGKVSSDFAIEMARMVLPALIGSAGTIVGAMFVSGRGRKGGS